MITTSGSDNSSVAPAAVMPKVPVTADTKGRLRVSKAQRRDILAALDRSGESLASVCAADRLKVFNAGQLGATQSSIQTFRTRAPVTVIGSRR